MLRKQIFLLSMVLALSLMVVVSISTASMDKVYPAFQTQLSSALLVKAPTDVGSSIMVANTHTAQMVSQIATLKKDVAYNGSEFGSFSQVVGVKTLIPQAIDTSNEMLKSLSVLSAKVSMMKMAAVLPTTIAKHGESTAFLDVMMASNSNVTSATRTYSLVEIGGTFAAIKNVVVKMEKCSQSVGSSAFVFI